MSQFDPERKSALFHFDGRSLVLVGTAAERGWPMMFSRIGVMRALHRRVERVFDPSRKDAHWGKRKLKRDQLSHTRAKKLMACQLSAD
jgi:hypothetical protein